MTYLARMADLGTGRSALTYLHAGVDFIIRVRDSVTRSTLISLVKCLGLTGRLQEILVIWIDL